MQQEGAEEKKISEDEAKRVEEEASKMRAAEDGEEWVTEVFIL